MPHRAGAREANVTGKPEEAWELCLSKDAQRGLSWGVCFSKLPLILMHKLEPGQVLTRSTSILKRRTAPHLATKSRQGRPAEAREPPVTRWNGRLLAARAVPWVGSLLAQTCSELCRGTDFLDS